MKRPTIQDRLAHALSAYEAVLSEAREEYERAKIRLEQARAALAEAEGAARRLTHRAAGAQRPRHLIPAERAELGAERER